MSAEKYLLDLAWLPFGGQRDHARSRAGCCASEAGSGASRATSSCAAPGKRGKAGASATSSARGRSKAGCASSRRETRACASCCRRSPGRATASPTSGSAGLVAAGRGSPRAFKLRFRRSQVLPRRENRRRADHPLPHRDGAGFVHRMRRRAEGDRTALAAHGIAMRERRPRIRFPKWIAGPAALKGYAVAGSVPAM
jgi:hypothetical protein